jgi:beta-carotene/zeaxanthin 4-ketolase
LLSMPFKLNNLSWILLGVLIQTHLYTGVFITAHDAIHGVVAVGKPKVNYWIGFVCTVLFAFNYYPTLSRKHHLHHAHVATDQDPDYFTGSFGPWYLKFLKEYLNVWQFLAMAVAFNLLKLWLPTENLIVFWMLPAILSTLQLFYFGTYQPHMGEHAPQDVHRSKSQALNHVKAFLTCYFFGYHHEHHDQPYLAWWQLPKAREANELRVLN